VEKINILLTRYFNAVLSLTIFFTGISLPVMSMANGLAICEQQIAKLGVGGHPVTVELAFTDQCRQRGLMERFVLPENHGMLFIYPRAQMLTFWMKDTKIPLSIAFISRQGKILNIDEMPPMVETIYASSSNGLYALEMRKGWFNEYGIIRGDSVTGLMHLPKAKD
jgi:hypothetical protein